MFFNKAKQAKIYTPKEVPTQPVKQPRMLNSALKLSNKGLKLALKGKPQAGGILINKAIQTAVDGGYETRIMNAVQSNIPQTSSLTYMTQNSADVLSASGLGGLNDFGANLGIGYRGQYNFIQILTESEVLYYQDWQSQKIIDIPANDILMKGFDFKGLDEIEIKSIRDELDKLDFYTIINQALRLERLHGGCVILMGLRSEIDNPEIPLNPDTVKEGDLTFLNVVPRVWLGRTNEGYDQTKPNYGKTDYFYFSGGDGEKVHKSRLMIFNGKPLQYGRQSYYGLVGSQFFNDEFGYPILGRMFHELKASTASRQAALHLLQRASILKYKGDIIASMAVRDGEENVGALQDLCNNISNYNAALINSIPGNEADLDMLQANLSGVADVEQMQIRTVCAMAGIPLVKFLGESPTGLNASGDTELTTYYDMLRAYQRFHLGPQLRKLLPVLLKSCGIRKSAEDVEITFPEFETVTIEKQAAIRKSDTEGIISLVSTGIISDEQALEELKQRDVLLTDPEDFPDPTLNEDDTNDNSTRGSKEESEKD